MAGGASAGPPAAFEERLRAERPERWLASRFVADPAKRGALVAFWAFAHELDRARRITSSDLIAEIRLTWWAEAMAEIAAGGEVRQAELVLALRDAVGRRWIDAGDLDRLVSLHLDQPEDQPARSSLEARIAGLVLDPGADPETLEAIGRRLAEKKGASDFAPRLSAAALPAVLEAAALNIRGPLRLRWRMFWAVASGRL